MRVVALFLCVAALAECSRAPTILDGSSQAQFERTAEKARRDLPIADRLTFDAALKAPPGKRYSAKNPQETLREAYDGMTAADVVADARARGIE